jgi:hypothetical protein
LVLLITTPLTGLSAAPLATQFAHPVSRAGRFSFKLFDGLFRKHPAPLPYYLDLSQTVSYEYRRVFKESRTPDAKAQTNLAYIKQL